MQRYTLFLIYAFAVASFAFGPCNESLPTYQAPDKIFEGSISTAYLLTIQYNAMSVQLVMVNIFDETFQAQGVLKGYVEIVSARDPSIRKRLEVGPGNVIHARGYDRNTGMLLIDPQDTIRVGVQWDFKADDSGRDLRRQFFQYIADTTCSTRCLAYTEDFIITGELKIYDQRAPVRFGPAGYSLCFVSQWVRPGDCPPIITSAPCNLRPPQSVKPCTPQF
ncbi:MAG: hypothetical protein HY276_03875 [Ignavibacteriales bacterium]|nr:hypothetical protein [Ignavibacteriales bacterium]